MFRNCLLRFMAVAIALNAFGCADERPADTTTGTAPRPEAGPAQRPDPTPAPTATPPPTPQVGYRGPLPPIPMSPDAAAAPDVVRAIYEFAARRPDVMRYVPCFCGCERNGHKDNEDCFVSARAADGRPEWDTHGLT
jgi:Protein of unknown function with PCYCGC motif